MTLKNERNAKGRELTEVIDRILAEIPSETHASLRADLGAVRSSAAFAAPEVMGGWWRRAQDCLVQHVGVPDPNVPWQVRVSRIFSGRE
jgi:hypothetical protein